MPNDEHYSRFRVNDFELPDAVEDDDWLDKIPGAQQATITFKGQPMPSSWRLMEIHDPELQATLEASARGDVVPFPDGNLYRVVYQDGPSAWTVDPIVIGPDEIVFRVEQGETMPDWQVGTVGTTRVAGREVQTEVIEVFGGGWFHLRAVGGA